MRKVDRLYIFFLLLVCSWCKLLNSLIIINHQWISSVFVAYNSFPVRFGHQYIYINCGVLAYCLRTHSFESQVNNDFSVKCSVTEPWIYRPISFQQLKTLFFCCPGFFFHIFCEWSLFFIEILAPPIYHCHIAVSFYFIIRRMPSTNNAITNVNFDKIDFDHNVVSVSISCPCTASHQS